MAKTRATAERVVQTAPPPTLCCGFTAGAPGNRALMLPLRSLLSAFPVLLRL